MVVGETKPSLPKAIEIIIKCDLHVHTGYSYDRTARPREMVEAALQKGINCLAITDHGEIQGQWKQLNIPKTNLF